MNAENTSLLLLFHLPKIGSQCTPAMQSFDILLLVLTLAQQRDLKLLTLELYPMKWPKQMVLLLLLLNLFSRVRLKRLSSSSSSMAKILEVYSCESCP